MGDWKGIYRCVTCGQTYTAYQADERNYCCTAGPHKKGDIVKLIPYDRRASSTGGEQAGLPKQDRPMWFVYDDEEGFAFFSSPESARLEAERRLQAWRDEAHEGWSDETETTLWGRVYQEARETTCISREEWEKTHDPEEEMFPGGDCDVYADYSLMPALLPSRADSGAQAPADVEQQIAQIIAEDQATEAQSFIPTENDVQCAIPIARRIVAEAFPMAKAPAESAHCEGCAGGKYIPCDDPDCGDSTHDHLCNAGYRKCTGIPGAQAEGGERSWLLDRIDAMVRDIRGMRRKPPTVTGKIEDALVDIEMRTAALRASPSPGLRERVLAMMTKRGWSTRWIERSCYLHLEAAELAEAVRGKKGDPVKEAGDVLITLLALSPVGMAEIIKAAEAKLTDLESAPPYAGEEITPAADCDHCGDRPCAAEPPDALRQLTAKWTSETLLAESPPEMNEEVDRDASNYKKGYQDGVTKCVEELRAALAAEKGGK